MNTFQSNVHEIRARWHQELELRGRRRRRRLAIATAIIWAAVGAAASFALFGCGDDWPKAIEYVVNVRPAACAEPPASSRFCGTYTSGLPEHRCRRADGTPFPQVCTVAGPPDRICYPDCPAPASCPRDARWMSIDLSNSVCPGAPEKYSIPCGLCHSTAGNLNACTVTVDFIESEGSAPIETPLWVCVASCGECVP